MKIVKKLLALALTGAFALTLLTGCSGGGSSAIGKESFTAEGVTYTLENVSDGNTELDKAIAEKSESIKYDRALSQKAREYIKNYLTVTELDEDEACRLAGIDKTKTEVLDAIIDNPNANAEEQVNAIEELAPIAGDSYGYVVVSMNRNGVSKMRIVMLIQNN